MLNDIHVIFILLISSLYILIILKNETNRYYINENNDKLFLFDKRF